MLYNVKGKLTVSDVNFIVVECGGVGFKCFTTLNTVKNIGKIGDEVNVFTYLAVRDDAMDLYGFATLDELNAFKLLITVSGIGPKAAAAILSELSPDRLAICIASGDAKSITKAQGVGKKTAERIILELKEKVDITSSDFVSSTTSINISSSKEINDAIEALVALGITKNDAIKAVQKASETAKDTNAIITLALRSMA